MLVTLVTFIFLYPFFIFANDSVNDIRGVLVQVESIKVSETDALIRLSSKFELTKKEFFPSLNVIFFSSSENSGLKLFCEEAIKVVGVKHCELSFKLKPQQRDCSVNEGASVAPHLEKILAATNCEIVPKQPAPHKVPGLSSLWAQEYTGGDLVREKLKDFKVPENLVAIWDATSEGHAYNVANLVAGPKETAMIPLEGNFTIKNLEATDDYPRSYENQLKALNQNGKFPKYINNSMSWANSSLISEVVSKLSDKTVFVSAAGNDSTLAEDVKVKLSRNNKLILVGNLAPDGTGSSSTNYSPELTISAPADYLITSYDQEISHPIKFGGTSAAAPQVTAALAAFTIITGHNLTVVQSKNLLNKTAIPLPLYPKKHTLGAGMLNAYKISEVATRINKLCPTKDPTCIEIKLNEPDLFIFSAEVAPLLSRTKTLFPECVGESKKNNAIERCDDRKQLLKDLRKAALLDTASEKLWGVISCISYLDGLDKNGKYYDSLSKRGKKSDQQLVEDLLKHKNAASHLLRILSSSDDKVVAELMKNPENYNTILAEYMEKPGSEIHPEWMDRIIDTKEHDIFVYFALSKPHWRKHPELVKKFIDRNDRSHFSLISYVLTQPQWVNHPELIEQIMNANISEHIDNSLVKSVISNPIWTKHPELVKKLVMSKRSDKMLDEYVFSNPEWQKVFGIVTAEELRRQLLKENVPTSSTSR